MSDSTTVIRDILPNRLTTFSTPFKRFGIIKIGGRGTLIKLATGNLVMFNPIPLTPSVQSKIDALSSTEPTGSVTYIIAPDYEHHLFLTPWSQKYPNASVIAPEGLPEKREKSAETSGTKFTHIFTKSNKLDMKISPEFDEEFQYEYVESHANKELVFLHKPTRTLIEADLLFALPATEQFSKSNEDPTSGVLTKLMGGLLNVRGDMKWQKRMLWYGVAAGDRKGFADSMRRIEKWGEWERLIPCHGDVIEHGGSRILKEAMVWFRDSN